MAIGGVVINWASKTRDAVSDTDRLARSILDVDRNAKKASGGLGKIGKAATAGIAGVGLVAAGAAVAFVDMAKAAYSDMQNQQKLERTLKRVKGVTDKAARATGAWIDKMELATLVSDDELRVALSKLTLATGDLSDAQKLAALAQDAAVGSGKSFTAVSEAMAKAAAGNTAALQKQFPFLDAGPDKVLTMAEAVGQLGDKYKGAAEAAADNDVFGRLGVAWGQIKEAIGSAALPALQDVSDWFKDPANITKIQGWITQLQTWATSIGTEVAGKIKEFVTWIKSDAGKAQIEKITQAIIDLGNALKTAADFAASLKGFIEWLAGNPIPNENLAPFDFQGKTLTPWLPEGQGGTGPPGGGAGGPGSRPGSRNYKGASGSGGTVVNIYNPKPERASTSVAAGLRVSRPNTVSV